MGQEALAALAPYASKLPRDPSAVAADLESLTGGLTKWQATHNLVSRETLAGLWDRHMADSLQLLNLIRPDDLRILDLGSGGGFPALPVAVALKGTERRFTLVESTQRKAAFLRAMARQLSLDVHVRQRRIEDLDPTEIGQVDLITSRALAPLTTLLSLARPFFRSEARAIFHKGREYGEELAEARAHWEFDVIIVPSDTSSDSVLLDLTNLRVRTIG